jgi:hypothetical protein
MLLIVISHLVFAVLPHQAVLLVDLYELCLLYCLIKLRLNALILFFVLLV